MKKYYLVLGPLGLLAGVYILSRGASQGPPRDHAAASKREPAASAVPLTDRNASEQGVEPLPPAPTAEVDAGQLRRDASVEPEYDPFTKVNPARAPLIREELDVWNLRQILDEFEGLPTGAVYWGQTSELGKITALMGSAVAAFQEAEGAASTSGTGIVLTGDKQWISYNGVDYAFPLGHYPVFDEAMAYKRAYMKARGETFEGEGDGPVLEMSAELRMRILAFGTEALEIRRARLLAIREKAK